MYKILLYAEVKGKDEFRVISTAKFKGHRRGFYILASRQTGKQTLFIRELRRDYGGKETSFLVAEYFWQWKESSGLDTF